MSGTRSDKKKAQNWKKDRLHGKIHIDQLIFMEIASSGMINGG